jgi:hypothetical protein
MRLTPSETKELATMKNAETWDRLQGSYSFTENLIMQYFWERAGDDAVMNTSDMDVNLELLDEALYQAHLRIADELKLYRSWVNDFLTTGKFAEHYNLPPARALEIIERGRAHHRRTGKKQDALFTVSASPTDGENLLLIQACDSDDQPLEIRVISYLSQANPALEEFCALENAMSSHGIEADIQGQDGTHYHGTIIN